MYYLHQAAYDVECRVNLFGVYIHGSLLYEGYHGTLVNISYRILSYLVLSIGHGQLAVALRGDDSVADAHIVLSAASCTALRGLRNDSVSDRIE